MNPTPNPSDLVGFHVTPLQVGGCGAFVVLIVVVILYLASRGTRGR